MERSFNKHVFVWLGAFACGMLGMDRFMRGQVALGIIKFITLGGLGIWYLVDLFIAAYKAYAPVGEHVYFVNGKWA